MIELLSPPHSSEKRAAAMAMGKDAGLISAMKRSRLAEGAYTEDLDPSPLQYVTVNEGEVRTAIKVLYVKQGAPPESEWGCKDGTINSICKQLNNDKATVEDTLRRI